MTDSSRLRETIARLTTLLRERSELGDLAGAVARDACALVGAESCSVMLLDQARGDISSYAAHGLTLEEQREIRFRVGEGIAGACVAESRPIRVDDVVFDVRFARRPQALSIRSILAVPIVVRGSVIGALTVTHQQAAKFADVEQSILELWAQAVGLDLESALHYRLSLVDPLTRAYNRRYLDEMAPRTLAQAALEGRPVAALFVDLDKFKAVNDRFGHDTGDAVLAETASRIRSCVRAEDVILRWGGDEFLVLLLGASAGEAREVAERIGARVAEPHRDEVGVTASVGVASSTGTVTFDQLLRQVDQAMYAAKAARAALDV